MRFLILALIVSHINRKIKTLLAVLFVLVFIGCSDQTIEVLELAIDKATIPEGIVVHPESKEIFISSIHLDKITRSDKSGKNSTDLIQSNESGYTTGLGMEIKDDFLYALGSFNRKKQSVLLKIDLKKNEVLQTFFKSGSTSDFFNDLALDNHHNAYITDTEFHKIYKYDNATKTISLFLEHEQLRYPNGIAISGDQTKLFIDSYSHGIRIIDIATKKILNAPHKPTTERGIDGLKYDNKNLYAIVNGGNDKTKHGVFRFRLADNEQEIIAEEPILVNHPKMNIPTTLAIVDDVIYILANSQLENLDQEKNKIINKNILENTYIIKVKIK